MKFHIPINLALISAVGTLLCSTGYLQAKQWLLFPEGEQEITVVEAKPDQPKLAQAKEILIKGQAAKAHEILEQWLKDFPDSPLVAEAMYYKAQSLEQQRQLYRAFGEYEKLIDQFSNSEYFYRALEAEFAIAQQYLNGSKRKVLGFFRISAEDVGVKILQRVSERWPGSDLAQQSLMSLGDYYLRKNLHADAVSSYQQLIESYPSSRFLRQARLSAAKAYLGQFNGAAYDPAPLVEAKERLLEYQRLYQPDEQTEQVQAMLERIEDLQAQRQYQIGRFYQRTGKKDSARSSFQQVVQRWPNSKWADKAEKHLKKFAKNS